MKTSILLSLVLVPGVNCDGFVGKVGSHSLNYGPAFLKLTDNNELWVTTFYNTVSDTAKDAKDAVYRFPISDFNGVEGFFNVNDQDMATDKVTWPNYIVEQQEMFPLSTGGKAKALSVACGFIVGKENKGGLTLVVDTQAQTENTEKNLLAFEVAPKNKWFYHNTEFVDIDNDGHLDLLTVRSSFNVPPFAIKFESSLVWFRNPGNIQITDDMIATGGDISSTYGHWEETIIDNNKILGGGDTTIRLFDLDNDGIPEIVTTHFWDATSGIFHWWGKKDPGPGIVVYSLKPGLTSWNGATFPENVERYTVADGFGGPFDLEFKDINGDGKIDLLTSNHEKDGDMAKVIVFEIPQGNWKTSEWKRHVIGQGFPNRVPEGMSPGAAQSFYPKNTPEYQSKKPWVVTSGDGTGMVHVLVPNSQDVADWSYKHLIVYDSALDVGASKTIGAIAVSKKYECTKFYVPVFEGQRIVMLDACEMVDKYDLLVKKSDEIWASIPSSGSSAGRPIERDINEHTFSYDNNAKTVVLPAVLGATGSLMIVVGAAIALRKRNKRRNASAVEDIEQDGTSMVAVNPIFDHNKFEN